MTLSANVNGKDRRREGRIHLGVRPWLPWRADEVLRTYHGELFLLDRHLTRLRRSAGAITLEPPLTDKQFGQRIRDTIQALPVAGDEPTEYYIRTILTRGVGDFGYDPAICPTPTLLIIVKHLTGPFSLQFGPRLP
jgi:branched-chain amino acid aminotransferase